MINAITRGIAAQSLFVELPEDVCTVEQSALEISTMAGAELLESTTYDISTVVDAGGGNITIVIGVHSVEDDDVVRVTGTTSYNGLFAVSDASELLSVEVEDAYVADESTGELEHLTGCSVYTGATLETAASRGAGTVVLASGAAALEAGQLIRIGTAAEGYDTTRVHSYNTSTRVVTLTDRLEHSHAAGSAVSGRWLSCVVDTTLAAWDSVSQVMLTWSPVGSKPFTELRQVLARESEVGGLQARFSSRWAAYAERIKTGDWSRWEIDARSNLSLALQSRGIDMSMAPDSELFAEILMLEIARMIAYSHGESFAVEREALDKIYADRFDVLINLPIWVDASQDKIMDDSEDTPAIPRGIGRGL